MSGATGHPLRHWNDTYPGGTTDTPPLPQLASLNPKRASCEGEGTVGSSHRKRASLPSPASPSASSVHHLCLLLPEQKWTRKGHAEERCISSALALHPSPHFLFYSICLFGSYKARGGWGGIQPAVSGRPREILVTAREAFWTGQAVEGRKGCASTSNGGGRGISLGRTLKCLLGSERLAYTCHIPRSSLSHVT